MQTPSPEHAEPPDAFESQPGAPGDDVHDHMPLSALANIVRSPGGVRSASKGVATTRGRTPNRSPLYSRANRPTTMSSARSRRSGRKNTNAASSFVFVTLKLRTRRSRGRTYPARSCPTSTVYRKANVDMTATPEHAATQRGGNAGKSVLLRGDAIHACVAKHILPVAHRTWTHRESGIYWTDVCAAVSAHVDALLTADPPMGKGDRELLSAAQYVWQWTRPENPDVVASSTLTKHAVMTFALTKSLMRPAEGYPQTSRPRVRLDDRLARRGPVCVCEEC
jgi:hypothetical protein